MKKRIWFVILVLGVIWAGVCSRTVVAQETKVEDFYKGATIRFIIPYEPGGNHDLWARMLSPSFEKQTGAKVVVENMPGAGGLVGGGYLYSLAKPDGLTLGVVNMPGMVISNVLGFESAKFEVDEFSYIGRLTVTQQAAVIKKDSPIKSIADMQKSATPIRFGATDPISLGAVGTVFFIEGFGLQGEIVLGYKGSKEYLRALVAGKELDAVVSNVLDHVENVKKGDYNFVAMTSKKRNPDFPQIPTIWEQGSLKQEGKNLFDLLNIIVESGRTVIAPPRVPEARRAFLEKVLSNSLKDPTVMDWVRKAGFNAPPLAYAEYTELMTKLKEIVPKSERPKISSMMKKYVGTY